MKKCAFLSMDNLDDFEVYDDLLIAPLHSYGWEVESISWRSKSVDWNDYDVVIIRTPWDYQDDAEAFVKVLEQIEASSAILENSINLVKWNIQKTYLKDLESQGVNIVPTKWIESLTEEQLLGFLKEFDNREMIIKPTLSANADDTYRINKDNITELTPTLLNVFNSKPGMVQPFLDSVVSEGEFSLFYFCGTYSHCILKTPKQDDFRVQEEHGGSLSSVIPESSLMEAANKTIDLIPYDMLYARVDFVRTNQGFALMELEAIEPSLYFNMDEKSPELFARLFAEKYSNLS